MLLISENSIVVQEKQLTSVCESDKTEQLRQILNDRAATKIDYESAQAIGNSLLEYFEILACEVDDESTD